MATGSQALAWAWESGDIDAIVHACWCYALALGRRGSRADLEASAALLQESAALLAPRAAFSWVLSFVLIELGYTVRLLGDRDRGLAYAADALEMAIAGGEGISIGSHHTQLGVMLQEEGDTAGAASQYGNGIRVLWGIGDTMTTGWAMVELASLAGLYGRAEESARLIGAVDSLRERTGNLLIARFPEGEKRAQSDLGPEDYARVHEIGRLTPLAEIVTEALTLSEELALIPCPPAPRAATASRAAASVSQVTPFGLSPRERDVLTLLCQRLTDAEIAEALFISRRTVTTHVSSIFNKMGVSNRREAAAAATRVGLV